MNSLYMKSFEICWEEISSSSYLRDVPAVRSLKTLTFHSPVTFFCGENGTGKTTVLRALAEAWGLNSDGGTRNYIADEERRSELSYAIRMNKGNPSCFRSFFRADCFRMTMERAEDEYECKYGNRSLEEQSHGEGFLSFLQSFNGRGLYFMDEPDAALSVQNQLALMCKMMEMTKKNAQFIIATHSPILLGFPDAEILDFDGGSISPCVYEETESFLLTSAFLRDRGSFIRHF